MLAALIWFAVLALLAVVAGEVSELPLRRRLADAGRLRASKERLRW
jgi:membrane protein DedA with SNARE-associated domain